MSWFRLCRLLPRPLGFHIHPSLPKFSTLVPTAGCATCGPRPRKLQASQFLKKETKQRQTNIKTTTKLNATRCTQLQETDDYLHLSAPGSDVTSGAGSEGHAVASSFCAKLAVVDRRRRRLEGIGGESYHALLGKLSWAEASGLGMKEEDQMPNLEGSGAGRSVGTQTGSMTGEWGAEGSCSCLPSLPPRLSPGALPALCAPLAWHATCSVSPTLLVPTCSVSPPRPGALPALCLRSSALSLPATPARPAAPWPPCQSPFSGLAVLPRLHRSASCPALLVAGPRRSIPGLKSLQLRFCFAFQIHRARCDSSLKFHLMGEDQACSNR